MSTFDDALKFTLAWEGGFVDHPADRGGATNMGVTQATYDADRKRRSFPLQSVRFCTVEEAYSIYERCYWLPNRCADLPALLACAHFDACVNHGAKNAAKMLQRAVIADVDGVIGPQTINAALDVVARYSDRWAVTRQLHFRKEFFLAIVERDRSQMAFFNGWMNRLADLAKVSGVAAP